MNDDPAGLFAVIWTDGEITTGQLQTELVDGQWVPLFVYRKKTSPKQLILPVFTDIKVAANFYKRNLPETWLGPFKGFFSIGKKDLVAFAARGWATEWFHFPNRMMDRTDIAVGFEVHQIPYVPKAWGGKS